MRLASMDSCSYVKEAQVYVDAYTKPQTIGGVQEAALALLSDLIHGAAE